MIRYDFVQRSTDWQRARLGIPTSSEFHRIITPKTVRLSEQAPGYMATLLAEWMLGAPLPSIETEYMQRGAQLEDEAVSAYEFATGLETEKVGFLTTDDGMIGCSPDRLVGDDGALEIKCPAANTHVGHMMTRKLDEKHKPQTQGQLMVSERLWVDTVSYYPGLPVVIMRSNRDEPFIELLVLAVGAFVMTMLRQREALEQAYGPIVRPTLPVASDDPGPLGITDEDAEDIIRALRRG